MTNNDDITFASEVYESGDDRTLLEHTEFEHIFVRKNGQYVAMAKRGALLGPGVASGWIDDTIEGVKTAMKMMKNTGHWPDGRELPIP